MHLPVVRAALCAVALAVLLVGPASVSATKTRPKGFRVDAKPGAYNMATTYVPASATNTDTWVVASADATNTTEYVRVQYGNRQLNHGWEYVSVAPSAALLRRNATLAYYAAGYAEAQQTFESMSNTFTNMYGPPPPVGPCVERWIRSHIAYLEAQQHNTAPLWAQISKQMALIAGLHAGYRDARNASANKTATRDLDHFSIFLLSFYAESPTIANRCNVQLFGVNATNITVGPSFGPLWYRTRMNEHCSALLKLTSDDVFVAHDTWAYYGMMYRQVKTYVFEATVTMSTYAGSLSSIDDFYITSHQLVVTETTNGFYNNSLYLEVVPTVASEFHRSMAANFLATSAEEWVRLFAQNISGTYCNQWMVLDMKRVAPASDYPLRHKAFYVLEELPTLVDYDDMTEHLRRHTYWAGYNRPYFRSIFDLSGFKLKEKQYGRFFSHRHTNRAKQFDALQWRVDGLDGMYWTMRYNDFTDDDHSKLMWCKPEGNETCVDVQSPAMAIASRFDYAPKTADVGTVPFLQEMANNAPFGAIDTKMTSYTAVMEDPSHPKMWAINGPTTTIAPFEPFVWSTYLKAHPSRAKMPRAGQADRFDYPVVLFNGTLIMSSAERPVNGGAGAPTGESHAAAHDVAIAVCAAGAFVVVVGAVLLRRSQRSAATAGEQAPLV